MFTCRGPCAPKDPAADTVRISMPPVKDECIEENPLNIEEKEEDVRQREEEARLQDKQRQEQEAERLRLEEQMRREREEEEERMRREGEEAEEQKRREFEELEEKKRLALEEAARAEAVREAEARQLAQERERKALVAAFLKEHGYNKVDVPKKTMLKTKYPIHTAAKTGDSKIVTALLEEGANPAQKNSSGQTALQVAQKKNKSGSHTTVLRTLGGA